MQSTLNAISRRRRKVTASRCDNYNTFVNPTRKKQLQPSRVFVFSPDRGVAPLVTIRAYLSPMCEGGFK
jgi:hypothetical protein